MLLTGTYVRSIDAKLRVAIPKPLRQAMDTPSKEGLYVAPGTDHCLTVYPKAEFERLAHRLADRSPTGQQVREFTRLFYSRAQYVELDGQGRIRVPAELAPLADVGPGEAVLLGVRDHLELWSKPRWDAYVEQRENHFDQIAEAAFGEATSESSSSDRRV